MHLVVIWDVWHFGSRVHHHYYIHHTDWKHFGWKSFDYISCKITRAQNKRRKTVILLFERIETKFRLFIDWMNGVFLYRSRSSIEPIWFLPQRKEHTANSHDETKCDRPPFFSFWIFQIRFRSSYRFDRYDFVSHQLKSEHTFYVHSNEHHLTYYEMFVNRFYFTRNNIVL